MFIITGGRTWAIEGGDTVRGAESCICWGKNVEVNGRLCLLSRVNEVAYIGYGRSHLLFGG